MHSPGTKQDPRWQPGLQIAGCVKKEQEHSPTFAQTGTADENIDTAIGTHKCIGDIRSRLTCEISERNDCWKQTIDHKAAESSRIERYKGIRSVAGAVKDVDRV
jgi:hypothetical protein